MRRDRRARADAQEAVPRPFLSALYGLEQERGPAVIDLTKEGKGCFEISKDLANHGNVGSLLGERLELLGRCAEHGWTSRGNQTPGWRIACGGKAKNPFILWP